MTHSTRKRKALNLEALPPSYPVTILMLDRLVHTADHPLCTDPTCPCQESAPFQRCSCSKCTFVRVTLSDWQAWNDTQEGQP